MFNIFGKKIISILEKLWKLINFPSIIVEIYV